MGDDCEGGGEGGLARVGAGGSECEVVRVWGMGVCVRGVGGFGWCKSCVWFLLLFKRGLEFFSAIFLRKSKDVC